jgi:hypothetical protein
MSAGAGAVTAGAAAAAGGAVVVVVAAAACAAAVSVVKCVGIAGKHGAISADGATAGAAVWPLAGAAAVLIALTAAVLIALTAAVAKDPSCGVDVAVIASGATATAADAAISFVPFNSSPFSSPSSSFEDGRVSGTIFPDVYGKEDNARSYCTPALLGDRSAAAMFKM